MLIIEHRPPVVTSTSDAGHAAPGRPSPGRPTRVDGADALPRRRPIIGPGRADLGGGGGVPEETALHAPGQRDRSPDDADAAAWAPAAGARGRQTLGAAPSIDADLEGGNLGRGGGEGEGRRRRRRLRVGDVAVGSVDFQPKGSGPVIRILLRRILMAGGRWDQVRTGGVQLFRGSGTGSRTRRDVIVVVVGPLATEEKVSDVRGARASTSGKSVAHFPAQINKIRERFRSM